MAASERQRLALARGPQVRSQRAHLARCIADGTVDLPALLEGAETAAEEVALGMRVDRLLTAAPWIGDDAAADLLSEAGVRGHRTLGEVTINQRAQLARALTRERTA